MWNWYFVYSSGWEYICFIESSVNVDQFSIEYALDRYYYITKHRFEEGPSLSYKIKMSLFVTEGDRHVFL